MKNEILNISEPKLYQATVADAPFIYQLLLHGEKNGSVLRRSPQEIAAVIDCFVYLKRPDGQYIACGSFEPYEMPDPTVETRGLGEVRSVVSIVPGAGYGKEVIFTVLQKARNLGIEDIYVTTDNIPYFEHLGFGKMRGGDSMLWMNLKTPQAKAAASVTGRVRDAFPTDKKHIFPMMQVDPTILSMSDEALDYKMGSAYVFESAEGKILGSVLALVYDNRVGGRPRMAEVRGLTVDENFKGRGIESLLLHKCWGKFTGLDVIQAFTTAPPQKAEMLLDSGFFGVMPGNKSVLWWNRK